VAGGEDLKVVSELLGHAGIAITADIYASVLPKLKNDAANRLDRLLGSAGEACSQSRPRDDVSSAARRANALVRASLARLDSNQD
jgi:hypothetical protein